MSGLANALRRHPELMVAAVLVLAVVVIGTINPVFWQPSNIFSLLRASVVSGILALAVLLVMLSGGIDVSFPAFAIAAMYLTVKAMIAWGFDGVVLPFLMASGIGLCLGLVNAVFVHYFRMIPLIVTLGTGTAVRGFILGVVGTSQINIGQMPPELIDFARTELFAVARPDGSMAGLSAMVLLFAVIALLVHLMLRYTMMGRSIYALGGGEEAARRVGFNVRRTTFFIYGLAGALAGFAGLLHGAMIWTANPRDMVGMELDVIAAVVLGGASIFGGRGTVIGAVLGVLTFVVITNSLIILGVDTTWQRIVVGLIVIAATAVTAWRDRKRLA
ncbi:ABC transporter permease [Roseomonas sp. E05]|uniref:ABC transporter permease n=1 Tax=Roseomonas sp. E05 TaxID=3046310 RepID=UPI0024BAB859|nr:ABC transporter permease [Roseomonas sp. E05]MDJ0389996.1 ABC transporter permease [Roseomonas sp. E05]